MAFSMKTRCSIQLLGIFPPSDGGRAEILMEPAFRAEFGQLQDQIPAMSVPGLRTSNATNGGKTPWGKRKENPWDHYIWISVITILVGITFPIDFCVLVDHYSIIRYY